MKKRGQITLFIIVGVVLVSATFLTIYYRDNILDLASDLNLLKTEEVPIEAKGIQDFVLDCIKETTVEGLDLIGRQGGYVEIPKDSIPVGTANIFSNKLTYIRGFDTAYWFYQKDNEVDVKNIPTISFIEKELEKYVEDNLGNCFDNFSVFEDYNIIHRMAGVNAEISDNEVVVEVDMPLSGGKGDVSFRFYEFNYEMDSYFGKLYDLGSQIAEMEEAESFFEEKTLDIMQVYDEIPMTNVDFECAPQFWGYEKVKADFKGILSSNMMFFKIKGTNYSLAKENRDYFEWDVTNKDYDEVVVNFLFDGSWPFYLEVVPNEGGVMRSEQVTDVASEFSTALKALFCVNHYHFVYDVKYPVLVTLNRGDDTLQFGMMVVVKNNQPREAEIFAEEIPEVDTRFCDNREHVSTVYTYESVDGEILPLEDVNIKYKCITHSCGIGKSILIGDEAYITAKFPLCINGILAGEKVGYNSYEETISSNNEFITNLILEPFTKIDIKVRVLREDLNAADGEPYENEQVVIELENEEKGHKTIILYPETRQINLLEGDYHAKIYILYEGGKIILAGKDIEKCVDAPKGGILGLFGGDEPKCFTTKIPEMKLSNFISGETEFDFYASDSDLKSDFVRFYIKQKTIPASVEDFEGLDFKTKPTLPVFLDE